MTPGSFTYRSARSAGFAWGIGAAIVIETLAVHLVVHVHHPRIAWALTALSVLALVWIARDQRALGTGAVRVERDRLSLTIGIRFAVDVDASVIGSVTRPTFRDLPAPGTTAGRDYINLTKPAQPNVLISLVSPVSVRLPGGLSKTVKRLALRLDDPTGFISACEVASASTTLSV